MTQQWNASIQHQVGTWMLDITYAANKGNHFAASGYNLNQVDPDVRLQLGQSLNTPVPNPYAGMVPGGLGRGDDHQGTSLMPFPYYKLSMFAIRGLGITCRISCSSTSEADGERAAGQSRLHRRQEDERFRS